MDERLYELLGCSEVFPDPNWRMPRHRHTHHELIVVKNGSMLLKTNEGEIVATRRDMLFYKAGLVHEESSRKGDPVNTLFVAFRAGQWLPPFPLRMRDSEGRVTDLLSWLVRDLRQGRPALDCHPLLRTVIQELSWLLNRPQDPWRDAIRSHLMKNFAGAISLGDIAWRAGMSRFAFIRKFKRLTGRTPMEDLRLIRLNEARNLILSTGLPLKAIAPAVGIGDEYQLSKLFRRHFGVSPREMRSRVAGKG
jgi:AraC-like DNA-binding protein